MNLREWARTTHRALSEQREEGGAALSGDVVEYVLRAGIISTLIDTLVDGGELRLDALGRLWIEEKAARWVVSNLAGRRRVYEVRCQRVVRFRASRRVVRDASLPGAAAEPDLHHWYSQLGQVYEQGGQHEQAKAVYDELASLTPRQP